MKITTVNKKTLLPITACVIASLTSIAQGQALLDVDFSSDTTGIYTNGTGTGPSGSTVSGVNTEIGNYIAVVDGSSTPSNPFGSGKSLMIQKQAGLGASAPTVRWNFDNLPTGSLTYDIFTDNTVSGFENITNIAYLYNSADATFALGVFVGSDGNIRLLGATTEGGTGVQITTGVSIANGVTSFKVAFAEGKFSVWYNDTLLHNSADPSQTEFWTRTGATSFDNVRFAQPSSNDANARFFVDNVMIVPEPSSIVLFLAGMFGLLALRRRKSNLP